MMITSGVTYRYVLESPVGNLLIGSDGEALRELRFTEVCPDSGDTASGGRAGIGANWSLLREVDRQLTAYFAGELEQFTVPVAGRGTDFQRRVWAELVTIPYGTTASYGEIAKRLGLPPGASRAVGLANGANPIAIVVPCHRVIGANGALVGYAGGVERKRYLLDLESRRAIQTGLFQTTGLTP